MIIDACSLPQDHRIECDICIIGGGAAGISLAAELAETPYRICLLESGGYGHEHATQSLLQGELIGSNYPLLHETRLAALGGSTALWAGWCRPLDPIDFEQRDWVPHSGWPFGAEELAPFYQSAHRLCGLGAADYDVHAWAERTGMRPLPILEQSLSATLFHISPINFGTYYRAMLERCSNIQALLHATVLRLFASSDNRHIERVGAITLGGKHIDVSARTFVLAAGGIENAHLLLLSGNSPEQAVGNRHGLVGRFFMEHAFINAGSYLAGDAQPSLDFHFPRTLMHDGHECTVRSGFSITAAAMRSERLLNGAVFFHPAYESHAAFDTPAVRAMLEIHDKLRGRAVPGGYVSRLLSSLRSPQQLAIAAYRKLTVGQQPQARWRTRALLECTPNPDNRVTLSGERDALGRARCRVEWRLGEQDLHSLRRMHELLDEALRKTGLGRFQPRLADDSSWRAAIEGGKHHMGTTRMHNDPTQGVVDAHCRVHEVDNLYIAGSSVFPTGGFANPTLTIVALAARLAAHLRRIHSAA